MKRDLRAEPLWQEVSEYFRRAQEPFGERLRAASDLCATADGREMAFTGVAVDALGAAPRSRIGIVDAAGGIARVTGGSRNARFPRFSPNDEFLAYLADGDDPGRFQLVVEERNAPHRALNVPAVDGTVESFAWSPGGTDVLIQTAALGADRSGAAGSGTLEASDDLPDWMPEVEEAVPTEMWRSLWRWRVGTAAAERIAPADVNVWEAAWSGDDAVLAIASRNPRESAWYTATLLRLERASGECRVLYTPREQLGVPAGDPSGRYAAVIEACCSDRTVVAGEVVVVDTEDDGVRRFVPDGIDVTHIAWRDASTLFCIGLRGFETVAGDLDVASGAFSVSFATRETCGLWYPAAAVLPNGGCALALESYGTYQRIAIVEGGEPRVVLDLAYAGSHFIASVGGRVEPVTWSGRDGLEIAGYLALPNGNGPHPLVVLVHGGPVYAFRNAWSMAYIFTPLLVARGYAVLHPNPRGSAGRGQAFARMVRGDMLGEDTYDIVAGVNALVERGIADRARIAVTGRSYGGMMASWLVTQTDVFAAAIPMAPVTDNVAQHFTSNIPVFDELFFAGSAYDAGGIFTERSPVLHARSAKTPALNVAGGRDRCTPPTQAMEFHRALVENGVDSELVIYPREGHHIESIDAQIDLCTRMLTWLDRYVPMSKER